MSNKSASIIDPKEYEELKLLATDRANEARHQLFERMTDLALESGQALSELGSNAFDDILVDLVRYVDKSVRAKVAERFSKADSPPMDFLRVLALDDIEIARPVLKDSPALSEEFLNDVLRAGSHDHQLEVASRSHLPKATSEVIVDSDDIELVERLADNSTAVLTPKILDRMAQMSAQSESLSARLIKRGDLPVVSAQRVFWWVSGALRKEILENHSVDLACLDQVLAEAVEEGIFEAAMDKNVCRIIEGITRGRRHGPNISQLVTVLRGGSLPAFTSALCDSLQVDRQTAIRIVRDGGGEAVALACRALDADRGQFTRIFLMLDHLRFGRARPAAHLAHVAGIYDLVTRDKALANVAIWDLISTRIE